MLSILLIYVFKILYKEQIVIFKLKIVVKKFWLYLEDKLGDLEEREENHP